MNEAYAPFCRNRTAVVSVTLLAASAPPATAQPAVPLPGSITQISAGYAAAPSGVATTANGTFTGPPCRARRSRESDSVEVDSHDADVTNDVQAFVARRANRQGAAHSADTFTKEQAP